jgi:hypothetical protein
VEGRADSRVSSAVPSAVLIPNCLDPPGPQHTAIQACLSLEKGPRQAWPTVRW